MVDTSRALLCRKAFLCLVFVSHISSVIGANFAFVSSLPGSVQSHKGTLPKPRFWKTGAAALRASTKGSSSTSDELPTATKAEQPVSSYQQSSGLVKGVVAGLTSLVNSVMNKDLAETVEEVARAPLTPAELRDGIQGDYDRMYLWTGDIDPDLYDASCVFTDPTLSFKGLATFQQNLANLRPIIDRLVREYDVELYSCDLDEGASKVVARWRMVGTLALPWAPVIDLQGSTQFQYEKRKGNRIVDYFETWETPAGTVLLNLLKPGSR